MADHPTTGLLTKEIVETERTFSDFVTWVDSINQRLMMSGDLRREFRHGGGLAKKFREEIQATSSWIKNGWLFLRRGTIRFEVGDQPFDAVVNLDDERGHTRSLLECVQAIAGRETSLRMEHLSEHGRVSLMRKMSESGSRAGKSRKVLETDQLIDPEERDGTLSMSRIEESIRRKMSMSYPTGTWLICSFDDILLRSTRRVPENLSNIVDEVAEKENHPFARIVLIGESGNIYSEWERKQ